MNHARCQTGCCKGTTREGGEGRGGEEAAPGGEGFGSLDRNSTLPPLSLPGRPLGAKPVSLQLCNMQTYSDFIFRLMGRGGGGRAAAARADKEGARGRAVALKSGSEHYLWFWQGQRQAVRSPQSLSPPSAGPRRWVQAEQGAFGARCAVRRRQRPQWNLCMLRGWGLHGAQPAKCQTARVRMLALPGCTAVATSWWKGGIALDARN